ncbi:MAG: HAD family hydrolase [Synergistetes bacterium]|nr:HAD family hydrolase [Synergistota bacterium]
MQEGGGKIIKPALLAVDLDGTLLSKDGELESHVISEFKRISGLNVRFMLATGRLTVAARRFAESLGSDLPIVACNGALVEDLDGKILFTIPMRKDAIVEVINAVKLIPGFSLHFFTPRGILALKMSEVLRFYMEYIKVGVNIVRSLDEIFKERDIIKLLILSETPKLVDRYLPFLRSYLNGRVYITRSFPTYVEVVDPKANKGVALERLLPYLGYRLEDVMAFGDSENDIEVFKRVGFSVAVANAVSALRRHADYISLRSFGDGVVEALRLFIK